MILIGQGWSGIYLKRCHLTRRPVWAVSFAMLFTLIMACSAESSPTPPAPVDTPASTPTITPAQTVGPTPAPLPTIATTTATDDRVFIQLTDPLDEPEYYCLDVPGAGSGVRLQSALQAHTCKPLDTAADELFTIDHPNAGQIYMEAYQLCLEAEEPGERSSLRLQPCSDSEHQRFILESGTIRQVGEGQDDLCLAVDPDPGIPTGGPSHLRRALTLESCESADPSLIIWSLGLFDY